MAEGSRTAVLEAAGMLRASEKAVVESAIGRRPGMIEVEANRVAHSAHRHLPLAGDDAHRASPVGPRARYHRARESVPEHVCDLVIAAGRDDAADAAPAPGEPGPTASPTRSSARGLELRPEVAALSMSGSSFIVAVNALMLKRLRLPSHADADTDREPLHRGRGHTLERA